MGLVDLLRYGAEVEENMSFSSWYDAHDGNHLLANKIDGGMTTTVFLDRRWLLGWGS